MPWPFTRAPYHFPFMWYFWSPGINWKTLTFLKICYPRLFQGLGLAPSEQLLFLEMLLCISSEKNFPNNTSWYWSPEQFAGLTFHPDTSSLSLNMVFLNSRDSCKTTDFCQSLPDQGSSKIWALLLWSKFHSCKPLWDWVLNRTFQHDTPWY
jgi:hypothetical protein